VPLLMRGPATVESWAPHGFATPEPDLYARVAALSQGDKILGPAIAEGLRDRGFSATVISGDAPARDRYAFPALAKAAGELLRADGITNVHYVQGDTSVDNSRWLARGDTDFDMNMPSMHITSIEAGTPMETTVLETREIGWRSLAL